MGSAKSVEDEMMKALLISPLLLLPLLFHWMRIANAKELCATLVAARCRDATAEECPSSSSANYLLRLAKDAWCPGTNCPAGCCPEANWFCCPDFQWCAAVAEECPESKKLFSLF